MKKLSHSGALADKDYQIRLIAFLDVLGFESEVNSSASLGHPKREAIFAAVDCFHSIRDEIRNGGGFDVQFCLFSDACFVSVAPEDDAAVLVFIKSVQSLSRNLLRLGFLCRGGLTLGACFHDTDRVFGPAANLAYRLEHERAEFPRIVLGRDAATRVRSLERPQSGLLSKSPDGPYHVNIFEPYAALAKNYCEDHLVNFRTEREFEEMKLCRLKIIDGLDVTQDFPRVYMKWRWLAEYYNSTVASWRGKVGEHWPGAIELDVL